MDAFLPLLPVLIPFAGAGLLSVLPRMRSAVAPRRTVLSLVLLAAMLSFPLTHAGRAPVAQRFSLGPSVPGLGSIHLAFDALAVHWGLLLLGTLMLLHGASLRVPMERSRAVWLLVAVGGAVWSFAATDVYSLAMAWGLIDVATVGYAARAMASRRRAIRFAVGALLSTMATVVALVLSLGLAGDSGIEAALDVGTPALWLVAAAIVRQGVYPLVGGFCRPLGLGLLSVFTGSCLWLRIGGLAPALLAGFGGLLPYVGAALLIAATLALLAPEPASSRAYVLLNGALASILASILEPSAGLGVAFLTLMSTGLGLALAESSRIAEASASVSLGPVPRWAAWATLGGWPLTLGFVCHWALLKLCLQTGAHALGLLAILSHLLVAMALWKRRPEAPARTQRRGAASWAARPWQVWFSATLCWAAAGGLILLGLAPGLLARFWPGMPAGTRVASLVTLLLGGISPSQGVVLALATLGPLWGCRLSARRLAPVTGQTRQAGHLVGAALELDWLYVALEASAAAVAREARKAFSLLEGPLYLAWVLVWILGAVFLLFEV